MRQENSLGELASLVGVFVVSKMASLSWGLINSGPVSKRPVNWDSGTQAPKKTQGPRNRLGLLGLLGCTTSAS